MNYRKNATNELTEQDQRREKRLLVEYELDSQVEI